MKPLKVLRSSTRERGDSMKRIVILILAVLLLTSPFAVYAKGNTTPKTDKQIVTQLCKKHKKQIRYVNGNNRRVADRIILHRKGKRYIVVEKVITTSKGSYGLDKYGYRTAYNKYVKKGTKVTSYIIYDPRSNEPDEILYVVDNKTYR